MLELWRLILLIVLSSTGYLLYIGARLGFESIDLTDYKIIACIFAGALILFGWSLT